MRFITSLAFLLFCSCVAFGQSAWQSVSSNIGPQEGENITAYQASILNLEVLQQTLKAAPMEFTAKAKSQPLSLALPMPNGNTRTFAVVESPVMEAGLSARYPDIKSYSGLAEDGTRLRFSVSPYGFRAFLDTPEGIIRIKPVEGDANTHLSYYLRDAKVLEDNAPILGCGYSASSEDEMLNHLRELDFEPTTPNEKSGAAPVNLRVYRMALSSTVNFSRSVSTSPTTNRILTTYNDVMNVLNGVFESEAAVRFVLIDRTDELIFLTDAEDPYNARNEGRRLIAQAQAIFNNIIPANTYEIGHVLTGSCIDVGGVASLGSVCRSDKAQGISCRFGGMSITRMVLRNMAHEVGHQFTATHTMSSCGDDENNQVGSTTYEPGSGSTIMSYAGGCGSDNIQNDSDNYFHGLNIEQIITYSREGTGSCGNAIPTANNDPELMLDYESGFYIPVSTPFELTANAFDPDGDAMNYCWEQFNAGALSTGSGFVNAASIRSYPPNGSPTRTIPRKITLLSGQSESTEQLPTFERDYTFRCTVRDNNPAGGGTVWEDVDFKVAANAGPFVVNYPSAETDALIAGQQVEVMWDVANTNNARVNCQRVNIRLSTDAGNTFPIMLLEDAANDGAEMVTIPDVTADNARIRVEAANNIFFNISRKNFPISAAAAPTVAVRPTPFFQQICLPAVASIDLATEAIGGFEGALNFAIEGLPEGATATFEPASVMAGESAALMIDLSNANTNGLTQYQITASSEDGTVAVTQAVEFNIISNDFSALELMTPANGTRGIVANANFEWTAVPNAVSYDFELSSSPAFGADDIIVSATALTGNSFLPEDLVLDESSLFYWRVRPSNECGVSAYTTPNVFQTINVQCVPFEQAEAVFIPGSGTPTVQSVITIDASGTITDLNIPIITANYPPLGFTQMTLVSPSDTRALLFSRECGTRRNFASGFDDEAPTGLNCDAIDAGVPYMPAEPLSIFDGENIQGDWKLEFRVASAGFGAGSLDNWQLESCANIEVAGPNLVLNEVFVLPPASRSQIWQTILEAQDEDNPTDEIIFELLSAPQHGTLYVRDTPLAMGDSFTQQDIDGFRLSYEHNGNEATEDGFDFIIRDTNGGWYGPDRFQIAIDEDGTVGTNDPALEQEIRIYPNPASARLNIELSENLAKDTQVRIFNVAGQQLRFVAAQAGNTLELNTSNFATGIYFIQIYSNDAFYTERVVIE